MSDTLELERYADLCNDEYGEACRLLVAISLRLPYLTGQFSKALKKEIKTQLNNFKENSEIIEREKTYTQKYEELEWLD